MGCVNCCRKADDPLFMKQKYQTYRAEEETTEKSDSVPNTDVDSLSWARTSDFSGSEDSDLGSECLSVAVWSSSDDDVTDVDPQDIIRALSPDEKPYCKSRLDYRSSSEQSAHDDDGAGGGDDDRLIHWKRGNKIGKGQFGTVWCGLTSDGELIAVKQMQLSTEDLDAAEQEYSRIYEEVTLLKSLSHKNIVNYIGSSFVDSIIFVFMEFVPGGSLRNLLRKFGPLEERVTSNYTRQLLQALQYIHNKNIIHRDIKCANVVLMPDGVIKLIDFGCAKQIPRRLLSGNSVRRKSTRRKREGSRRRNSKRMSRKVASPRLQTSLRGTPYWMSPEVVTQTGHDKTADIWSLGCSVIEMLTGNPPWSDRDPVSAMFAIGNGVEMETIPPEHSKPAKTFVNICLNRNKSERPSASKLLLHDFVQLTHVKRRQSVL